MIEYEVVEWVYFNTTPDKVVSNIFAKSDKQRNLLEANGWKLKAMGGELNAGSLGGNRGHILFEKEIECTSHEYKWNKHKQLYDCEHCESIRISRNNIYLITNMDSGYITLKRRS